MWVGSKRPKTAVVLFVFSLGTNSREALRQPPSLPAYALSLQQDLPSQICRRVACIHIKPRQGASQPALTRRNHPPSARTFLRPGITILSSGLGVGEGEDASNFDFDENRWTWTPSSPSTSAAAAAAAASAPAGRPSSPTSFRRAGGPARTKSPGIGTASLPALPMSISTPWLWLSTSSGGGGGGVGADVIDMDSISSKISSFFSGGGQQQAPAGAGARAGAVAAGAEGQSLRGGDDGSAPAGAGGALGGYVGGSGEGSGGPGMEARSGREGATTVWQEEDFAVAELKVRVGVCGWVVAGWLAAYHV